MACRWTGIRHSGQKWICGALSSSASLRLQCPQRLQTSSAERTLKWESGGRSPAQEKLGGRRWRSGFSSAGGEDDGSCEVNGRSLTGRGESPFSLTAGSRCRYEDGGLRVCPCAARTCGSPAGTVRAPPGGSRSRASAALEWVCDQEEGWESSPSQPKVSAGLVQGCLEWWKEGDGRGWGWGWNGGWGGVGGGVRERGGEWGPLGTRTTGYTEAKVILTKS